MDDPVSQIPEIISLLVSSPPTIQQQTIEKFFTPDASFTHPFCRTGSFEGSRRLIIFIYQWYKIMSPKIKLDVKSVAFDMENLVLYVTFSQVFRIWVIPFYKADVMGTTVLRLTTRAPRPADGGGGGGGGDGKNTIAPALRALSSSLLNETRYWITSQNDLYQTTDFIKFVSPLRILYGALVLWQYVATAFCVLGAYALWPVTWVEDNTLVHKRAREIEMVDHSRDE